MDDIAMLGTIRSRADFLRFLDAFQKHVQSDDVRDYLEAIAGWTADMDGYYRNSGGCPAGSQLGFYCNIVIRRQHL